MATYIQHKWKVLYYWATFSYLRYRDWNSRNFPTIDPIKVPLQNPYRVILVTERPDHSLALCGIRASHYQWEFWRRRLVRVEPNSDRRRTSRVVLGDSLFCGKARPLVGEERFLLEKASTARVWMSWMYRGAQVEFSVDFAHWNEIITPGWNNVSFDSAFVKWVQHPPDCIPYCQSFE